MRSFCKAARRGTPAAAWRAHRQILPDGPVLLPTQGLPAWQRTTVLSKGTISWLAQQARTFAAAAGLIDVPCPDFGAESVTEGTLMEWQKNVGDFVAKGELLASIETDKVTVDLTAPESGIVRELLLPNDGTAVKGSILLRLEPSAGSGAAAAAPASSPAAPSAKSTPSPTAPAAAGELKGIRAGFAHAAMLRAQRSGKAPPAAPATAPAPKAAPATAPAPSTAPTPMKIPSTGRGERRVPITPPRRQVISVLKESQNTAASLTTFQECDVGFAQDICKKHEDAFQKTYGAPLGLLSLFVKACSGALAEVPGVNGIIDEQTIRYRDYVDIGVPIPTPRGFVTCVLRNAETMSVPAIEQSIAAFREKARKDELSIADIEGGTFSIFDSGSSGGMLGTPIISPGMSACLGTNVVKKRPVAAAGKVVARPMMFLALTYDHRLIDGREAVTFLCSIRDKIEDPTRLLVGI